MDWPSLVRQCLDGNETAWAALVQTQSKRVYALCYRFTGSAHDAEDLTQDVFVKVYGNLASFDAARGSFETWLIALARNLLVDHFRRTRQQRATSSIDAGWDRLSGSAGSDKSDGGKCGHAIEPAAAARLSPHEEAARSELQRIVQSALAEVSPELREAVILRDLQDMDYKEIAQALHIPEGTVKSRISRGRAELARLLDRITKRQVV